MDTQEFFEQLRQIRSQYHLTLGSMIEILRDQPKDSVVRLLGKGLCPCNPHSYRGYYSDLAFETTSDPVTCEEFLKECNHALGKTFEGYKGGDFTMDEDTPLWISEYGVSSQTAIVGRFINDSGLVLMTKQIKS